MGGWAEPHPFYTRQGNRLQSRLPGYHGASGEGEDLGGGEPGLLPAPGLQQAPVSPTHAALLLSSAPTSLPPSAPLTPHPPAPLTPHPSPSSPQLLHPGI